MGTKFKGDAETVLALNTYIKFERAHSAVARNLSMHSPVFDSLTESQFGILEALHHLGPLCQKELGEKILKTKGDVTQILSRLLNKKLISRKVSERDRRKFVIELTNEGSSLVTALMVDHFLAVKNIFSSLSEKEQVLLGSLCKKLGTGPH